MVLDVWRFLARRIGLGFADYVLTTSVVRWTWAGSANDDLVAALGEFRPTDHDSIAEMMAGRYLLASRLVDTHGISPFAVETEDHEWSDELRSFSWLRHFRNARDDGERRFARTLTLDWIGREGRFNRTYWAPALCARRVLNWLRHFPLLIEGASPEQIRSIARSLATQIQSLKLRGALASNPVDGLFAAIALAGVALCDDRRGSDLNSRLTKLNRLLDEQIDDDGLHLTRSAKVQLQILVDLVTLVQGLQRDHPAQARELELVSDSMQRALDAISLGTGEPAYFNGTGQLPHDLIVSVQVQSTARSRTSGTTGGYGRLISGKGVVVADGGLVPPPEYAAEGHASALAFEFSYGPELVVGNCGPAPADFEGSSLLFRQGIAHSGPTINAASAARIAASGPAAGLLRPKGLPGDLSADTDNEALVISTHAYRQQFRVELERRLTLLSDGKSLVGQDRMVASGRRRSRGMCSVRFHLALGTSVAPGNDDDVLRLRLASGAVWTFLWEGADMRVDDSVRQSAYFGFHRIKQIVLDAPVEDGAEIAWIFTLDEK